jgi:hypothetical protein
MSTVCPVEVKPYASSNARRSSSRRPPYTLADLEETPKIGAAAGHHSATSPHLADPQQLQLTPLI